MALVAYKSWAVDDTGAVIANADIEIRERDGSTATTIYSDDTGTAQENPYTASADGSFSFWAPAGKYDARVGPAAAPAVKPITLNDPFADAVNPMQFGAKGDGTTDDTDAIRACHTYANENNLPVSYAGISSIAVQAGAIIDVNTSVYGHGVSVSLLNGVNGTPSFDDMNILFVVSDPLTPLLSGTIDTPTSDPSLVASFEAGSTTPTADFMQSMGYAYIQGSGGTGPNIPNRTKDGVATYRQPFAVQRQGVSVHPLGVDMTSETEIWYQVRSMPQQGRIVISGFKFVMESFNNQKLFNVQRNATTIEDMVFSQDDGAIDTQTVNCLIQVDDCAYINVNRITATAQSAGGESTGTYVLRVNNAAEVYVDGMIAIEGWGSIASDHVSGFYVTNSAINRFDAHAGGHNMYARNSTFNGIGIRYGWGSGDLVASDCRFVNCPAIKSRVDYGGFWLGDIKLSNPTFVTDEFNLYAVDLDGVGTEVISYPAARSIEIVGLGRSDNDDNSSSRMITPLRMTQNTSVGYVGANAPSSITVDGVSCAGRWRFAMVLDLKNMLGPDNADECSINIVGVNAPQANTTDLGVNILDDAGTISGAGTFDATISFSASKNISINTASYSEIAHNIYGCSVNRADINSNASTRMVGGELTSPQLVDAETHAPFGGGSVTLQDVTVNGVDAASGWDLSDVTEMSGVIIANTTENSGTIYPAGCDAAQAFNGWRDDISFGDFTVAITDESGNTSATSMGGMYMISQGVARVTYYAAFNIDTTGMVSGDNVRFSSPVMASGSGLSQQYAHVATQQLGDPGTYFARTVAGTSLVEIVKVTSGNVDTVTWSDMAGDAADILGFTIDVVL